MSLPDPTQYTLKCEFCSAPVTFSVKVGETMEEVFWDHYLNGCVKTIARLVRVITWAIGKSTDDHVTYSHSRHK